MTELDIIKELIKAFSSHKPIVLNMQDGSRFSGTIQFFDGETVTMDGHQWSLPIITSVAPYEEVQVGVEDTAIQDEFSGYKGRSVDIVCRKDGEQNALEGFLFDIRNGLIALITKTAKIIVRCEDVVSISMAKEFSQDKQLLERESGEASKFEKALLEGNRVIVDHYLENLEALKEQGYSDDEISYIQKRAKAPVPWSDDEKNRLYNQARRIFEYEGNRHQLVSNLLKQYLNGSAAYNKTRVKAVTLLIDILSEEQPKELLPFFAQNEELIRNNGFISLKVATAFLQAGEYKKARMLIDETRTDVDFSDLLFSLSFYEEHTDCDFSSLLGVDAFDSDTTFKELANLIKLPNKNAFIQLLSYYSSKERLSTFFSLLDLFMPYARNDSRIVSLTGECMLKEGAESYIGQYLPMFPLLWLNKSLTTKYLKAHTEYTSEDETVIHLVNQCERTAKYYFPNELEEAIINGNYELFEVLRGNNSILLSLGYSSEEIDRIRDVDADLIRYGNKTTIEKLLSLEGNRNHVPESVAGKDFLSAPKAVGEMLFPILIDAGCGDLVYELFNYSPRIRSQLISLDQYYIKALLHLKKDEELWNLVKDAWLTMSLDPEVLSVVQKVAREKGNDEVAEAMGIYMHKAPLNELENALISGNIAKLRSLITDADYLDEAGYSLEEIKLLQESMRRWIDTSLTDHLSIANRVYTFQKNKNRTAELYYMLALADGNNLAASGLFSIYASENRPKKLCNVYEQYLLKDPFSDLVQNRELYLLALYDTEDYERFYSYWKERHSDISIDPIYVLKVMLCVSAPDSEIEEVLSTRIKVNKTSKAVAKDCLTLLCQKEATPSSTSWIIRLFNAFFLVCDKNDAQIIRDYLDNRSTEFEAPEGNGLTLLLHGSQENECLKEWIDYLFGKYPDPEDQLLVLGNTIAVFDDGSSTFRDIIRAFVKDLLNQGIDVPEEYRAYLKPVFRDDEEKTKWLSDKLRHPENIDESDFEIFTELTKEPGRTQPLEQLLIELSEHDLNFNGIYVASALRLVGNAKDYALSAKTAEELLKCITPRLSRVRLSADSLGMLFKAYQFVENYDAAYLVKYVLSESGMLDTFEDDSLSKAVLSEQSLSLFEVVRKTLAAGINDIDAVASFIGQYLRINEADAAGLDAIKDYYNSPSKWDNHALDSLAKYTLCKPSMTLYWRLMDVYFSESCPEKYCVRYHIAKLDKTSFGPVILDTARHNLRDLTVSILYAVFSEALPASFEKSFDAVKLVVAKCNEWLSDKTSSTKLITALHGNGNLKDASQIWGDAVSLAMDIAFYGHIEGTFYALFGESLRNELAVLHEKFLCRLLLDTLDQSELISSVSSSIRDSAIDTPYKEIVSAITSEAKGNMLTPVQRDLLEIVIDNNGSSRDENAVYRYYLRSIVEGNQDTALPVVERLSCFYPEWPVTLDIRKYAVLSKDVEDTDVAKLYKDECASIKKEPLQERIYKSIVNTLPGELYLQSKGYEIESIYEYGLRTLPNRFANYLRTQGDQLKSLDTVFGEEKYPGLSALFMRCIFLRKWGDFLRYNLEDTSINDIIKSDETIKKLLLTKTYEVLKSSILSILDADKDDDAIIDRAFSLMAATEGLKRSKNYLRRIRVLDQSDADALRKVFSLRIESTSLRRNGFIGASILQVSGNEKVAYLIGMLDSKHLADIFNNDEAMNALLQMPTDRALTISEIYSSFFFKGISNVFSKFINDQTSQGDSDLFTNNPFENEGDQCKPFREIYLKSKDIFERLESPTNVQRRKHAASKAEYLFNAVINDSANDITIIQPTCTDYLTVFMYLFNRRTTTEMKEYLTHLDSVSLSPSLAVILSLLEQYSSAYAVASQIDESLWKDAVFKILYKALFSPFTPEERDIKRNIQSLIQVDRTYSIGKFVPVNADQVPVYIAKIKALREFLDETLSYLSYCGIDVSYVTFDQERYEKALSHYGDSEKKDSEAVAEPKIPEEKPLVVSQFIERADIYSLLESYGDVEAISHPEKQIPVLRECIGELKYFFASKRNSQDKKDILRIRDLLRWTYIRIMEESGFSREHFNKALELISKEDSISKAQWSAIIYNLNQYFDNVDSLQKLSRIAENDIVNLRNIGNVKNANFQLLSNKDTGAWEAIIGVLESIASISTDSISERDLLDQLSSVRRRLLSAQEKNRGTVFSQSTAIMLNLLSREITVLQHTPELSITVPEEQENKNLSIIWESENNKGTLYAVISNIGGADCANVTLVSRINMKSVHRYRIKTIYAGEKVPFKAVFYSDDVVGGKLTWDLEVSYYDADKDQPVSMLHETSVTVTRGGEPINIGIINTGNPAKGKDFVGRQRELSLLRNHYSDEQLPSMLVRGLKRSGKSSLIIKLADELRRRDRFLVAMVDGQSIGGNIRSAFVNKVLDSIRINYRSSVAYKAVMTDQFNEFQTLWQTKMDSPDWIGNLDVFYYELSQLFQRKILIVIDEMESIFYNHRFESVAQEDSLYAALRALIQNPDNYVSFVFCGSDTLLTSCLEQRRESQMFQTLQFLEVGRMNNGDIKEIFRKQSAKYDVQFTPDAVDAIWQYTHGLVWYAKLIGYLVVNNILAKDLTIRKEVNRSDIATAVQMLINGEIGTDKFDLVDASLNTLRASLVHAMASIMPDHNKEVSIDEIATAMKMMQMEGYKNPRNGEPVPDFDEKLIVSNLEFLEKMQFLDANASRTKYAFTADLYRLFFRTDKKLHLFEERSV